MAKLNFETREQALAYLDNMPLTTIKNLAVDTLMRTEETNKILITEEQLRTYFKIKGVTQDGEIETRGRKPKIKTEEPTLM